MTALPPIVHLDLQPGWRGGQRQVWLLLRALAARGARQAAVVRRGEPLAARLKQIGGVDVIEVGGRWQAWRRMPRPSGAILHAHSGNTIPLAVLARGRGRLAVVTRRVALAPRRWPIAAADHVVAISPYVADVLRDAGVPAARISVIPSAIDPSRRADPAARPRLRAGIGVAAAAPLGLTVAALTPEKDAPSLVRALAQAPADIHHVWIGDGPEMPAVRALARELGVADRLHLLGFVPDPDDWFAAADWFVLPSRHEGFGSVLLDAFHFGLPVIGTEIGGPAQLLAAGAALTVAPGDHAAMAAALQQLRAGPELADRLTSTARERLAGYGIDAVAGLYGDLYARLAAADSAPR